MKLHAGKNKPEAELFELMADTVKDYAIFILDDEGRIASWNKGAETIKGYKADEIIGKHFSLFYTPEDIDRNWPEQELNRAAQTGRFEDEGWRVKKDGSRFWANVIITALKDPDGKVLAYSKITRDLTERKTAEETLRLSEERFRLLVEGVTDYAIYMLDPEGRVSSWNSGAEQITGYRSEEILGRHISTFYSADDVAKGKPDTELAQARINGRSEEEGFRIRKNGTRYWARVVVTTLTDSHGKLRGFAKVTQDLTQRKHAEALENVTRNINEFIAVLAHELRNPLSPIRSAVHLLKEEHDLSEGNRKIVNIVDRQSGQLMRIVDDIIDVSRITRGKFSIIKKPVKVQDIVTRSVEAARPAIEAMGHTLTINMDDASLVVTGDEVRLSQALTNLLNNATRYTPAGGAIQLNVRADVQRASHELIVEVKDNGRGIAPEFINSIFGMFVQGEEKRNVSGAGLGVGLALARSIIELHQGTLEAGSEGLGKGAIFTMRLPLNQALAYNGTTHRHMLAANDRCNILIVDDSEDITTLTGSLFEKRGHCVLVANSGKQALEIFDQHHPDMVLMDIGMPKMNGYELARLIRNHPYGKTTFLVAITGWGKDDDRYRSKEAGIDLHLVKPVESEDLLALLDNPELKLAMNKP